MSGNRDGFLTRWHSDKPVQAIVGCKHYFVASFLADFSFLDLYTSFSVDNNVTSLKPSISLCKWEKGTNYEWLQQSDLVIDTKENRAILFWRNHDRANIWNDAGSINVLVVNRLISSAENYFLVNPARYGVEWTGLMSLLSKSIGCWPMLIDAKCPSRMPQKSLSIPKNACWWPLNFAGSLTSSFESCFEISSSLLLTTSC